MTRVVIVTGGAQGIGLVLTQCLRKEGFAVSAWDTDEEALADARRESDALFLSCDVSRENEVADALAATIARFGQIDALVNNAGIGVRKSLSEISLEEWNRVLAVNLTGPFLCAKHAEPYLRQTKGGIINLCSTRAFQSEPDTFPYTASKGGVWALTHSLAVSLGPDIRVNAISPGWIDVSPYQKASHRKPEVLRPEDHSQHPAGRVGTPEDIARMVLFLLNPENSFLTGQNFTVDGGITRKMIYLE